MKTTDNRTNGQYTTDNGCVEWTYNGSATTLAAVNLLIDAGFSIATDQCDDTEAVAMLLSSLRELCAEHELSFDDALAMSTNAPEGRK